MADANALSIARSYHDAWTGGDFERATSLLASDLVVDVPLNHYPTPDAFASALRSFGAMATDVALLSETAADDEAMLLYDMDVPGVGRLRIAEHFTVSGDRIARLRQVHDTAELRAAGFGSGSASDYRCTVRYAAPVARVYDAAAQPGGPAGWWTTSGGGATERGKRMRLNWSDTDYVVFRLDELDRPTAMRWTCVEQRDGNLAQPDEWVGTTLSFRFSAEGDGTRLDFVHHGLVPALACFDACEDGWAFFLRRSLKQLVEAGEGLPHRAGGQAG
jgi:uncharacterized protein YndB with AHSA1/START domain